MSIHEKEESYIRAIEDEIATLEKAIAKRRQQWANLLRDRGDERVKYMGLPPKAAAIDFLKEHGIPTPFRQLVRELEQRGANLNPDGSYKKKGNVDQALKNAFRDGDLQCENDLVSLRTWSDPGWINTGRTNRLTKKD